MRFIILCALAALLQSCIGQAYASPEEQSYAVSASTAGTCSAVTASSTILAANQKRRGALIIPLGTNTKRARFAFGTTATTSQLPLEAGQPLPIDPTYRGAVSVISDDGATSITVCRTEW